MKKRKCQECGEFFYGEPALSRKDNKTKVCSNCGLVEAMIDFFNYGLYRNK